MGSCSSHTGFWSLATPIMRSLEGEYPDSRLKAQTERGWKAQRHRFGATVGQFCLLAGLRAQVSPGREGEFKEVSQERFVHQPSLMDGQQTDPCLGHSRTSASLQSCCTFSHSTSLARAVDHPFGTVKVEESQKDQESMQCTYHAVYAVRYDEGHSTWTQELGASPVQVVSAGRPFLLSGSA